MARATRSIYNRIALVFDFDDTLAEDSFAALLRHVGFDPDAFGEERVQPLVEAGWEKILARSYSLLQASREGVAPITREVLADVGADLELFEGVQDMFDRVREAAEAIVEDVAVEFYLLTSGFVDIPRATPIAGRFEALWGNEFHFEDDAIAFVRKIVPHAEKPRYLQLLSKGLQERNGNPVDAYRDVPEDELHVPLSQVVYVADGASDIPAFNLMHDSGGIALGIAVDNDPEDWEYLQRLQSGQRVQNLASAGYGEGSELLRSLVLATETIGKQIALRQLSAGK